MRRINGSGSVYKLKDKPRHRPWIAVSAKRNPYGVTERKIVGYYASKKEAVSALDGYNVDPYALGPDKLLNDVFQLWIEEYQYQAAPKTVKTYSYMWNLWEPFFSKPIREIRPSDLQHHLDTLDKTPSSKAAMKKVISNVYEFAIKNDFAVKNAGKYLFVPSRNQDGPKRPHVPYSDDEIGILWKNEDNDYAALQLILIYCGCRIGEILNLDPADVDMENRTFVVRVAKTAAGVRTVPIADKTFHLWERFLARGGKHLIVSDFGNEIKYQAVRVNWDAFNDSIGIHHIPHDTRHTAITRMITAGIDDRTVKKVVGHKSGDVTADVYTHIDMEELRRAVNSI